MMFGIYSEWAGELPVIISSYNDTAAIESNEESGDDSFISDSLFFCVIT